LPRGPSQRAEVVALGGQPPTQRFQTLVRGVGVVTVVRLRAPLRVLHARIHRREAGDPSWFLAAATHTAQVLEQAEVEDYLVDTEDRPAPAVAAHVLRLVGWLGPQAGA